MMESPVFTGAAPGRIDFMGGVADYSGSLVLEMPIPHQTRVQIRLVEEDKIKLYSQAMGRAEIQLSPLVAALNARAAHQELRQLLDENEKETGIPSWTKYVLGSLLVFAKAKGWRPQTGLDIQVDSTVPQSMGVSSSAALEIATLAALVELTGLSFSGTEMARLGQVAENELVGAPCGLMDQLTSAYGQPEALLPILCRPDQLGEPVKLPETLTVVGWPSGVKHDVGASPYGIARTATFMGKKLLETKLNEKWAYAAEIPPSFFHQVAVNLVPETINGRQFLAEYGQPDDPLSTVAEEITYRVRNALRFPIEENFRCALAASLLRQGPDQAVLTQVGELMLQSHAGYSSIGLGSSETDQMVEALVELGPPAGIYGARISGGGSGGTVVVLLEKSARPVLAALAQKLYFSEAPLALIY